MPTTVVDAVWDEMYDRVGVDLRTVTGYDNIEFETRMREDVRAQYTDTDDVQIIDDTIVDQFSERRLEEKYNMGELHATVRYFDECWLVSWFYPGERKSGILVSIQRDGSEASFEDVEYCLEYLEAEIEPAIRDSA